MTKLFNLVTEPKSDLITHSYVLSKLSISTSHRFKSKLFNLKFGINCKPVFCEVGVGDGEGATVGVGDGEGATVGVGDGEGATVGVGDGEGATVGVGDGDGVTVTEGVGVALLTLTPLFQTSFLFFLTQVKRKPFDTRVFPALLHLAPGLGVTASAFEIGTNKETNIAKAKLNLRISEVYLSQKFIASH